MNNFVKINPKSFGPGVRQLNPGVVDPLPYNGPVYIRPIVEDLNNEKQFQSQVAALLRNRGIVFQRSRMDCKTTGTVGIPDFLFAVPQGKDWGRPCAFECKMPGGKLSEEQARCIASMADNGWDVRIVYSVDDVLTAFKEWGVKELI